MRREKNAQLCLNMHAERVLTRLHALAAGYAARYGLACLVHQERGNTHATRTAWLTHRQLILAYHGATRYILLIPSSWTDAIDPRGEDKTRDPDSIFLSSVN